MISLGFPVPKVDGSFGEFFGDGRVLVAKFQRIAVEGAAEGPPFEITSTEWNKDIEAPEYTVTWNSTETAQYALFFSTNLELWLEIDDSIESEGETTSYTHSLLPFYGDFVGGRVIFYRVMLVEPEE